MHEVVIRGGTVVDGTGRPGVLADVAIEGGRIVALGRIGGRGREELDARDKVVAPGFIDVHTHYDAQYLWDPYATSSIWHGVTTTVIGNCGFAIAPCRPEHRDAVVRTLVNVEGMSLKAMQSGIRWGFETFPQYLDFLDECRPALNLGAFVPHSTVRTWVMGKDAQRRAASEAEIAQMETLVREAMAAGAIGFASSTLEAHNGEGGMPVPSRLASFDELLRLNRAMGQTGRGVFEITVGAKTSLEQLAQISRASGRPAVGAAFMHREDMPHETFAALEKVEACQREGVELRLQVSCRPVTMDFNIGNPYCFGGFDVWDALFKRPKSEWPAAFADAAFRQSFRDNLKRRHLAPFRGRWDLLRVLKVARPENRACEGLTVPELARRMGRDEVDAVLDLALSDDLATELAGGLMNTDDEVVGQLITHPRTLVSLSDAGAHLHLFCDAGYTGTLLGKWVREKRRLSLEEAVRRVTSDPADLYRIPGRGRLQPGAWADVVIFDPDQVDAMPLEWVRDLPGGEGRFVSKARGVFHSLVNGVQVLRNGEIVARPAAERPGQVLRTFPA